MSQSGPRHEVDSFSRTPGPQKIQKITYNTYHGSLVPSYDITMIQTSAAASFTSHETAFPVTEIVPRRTSAKPDARGLSRACRILNRYPRGESVNRLSEAHQCVAHQLPISTLSAFKCHSIGHRGVYARVQPPVYLPTQLRTAFRTHTKRPTWQKWCPGIFLSSTSQKLLNE